MSAVREGASKGNPDEEKAPTQDESFGSDMEMDGFSDLQRFEVILERTKPAFESLVAQLRTQILDGIYSDIVVDDTSARLLGRMLRRVMKDVHDAKIGATPGPAKIHFVAGGRGLKDRAEAMEAYLEEIRTEKIGNMRTLLLTEHVASGSSLNRLLAAMKSAGFKHYDVAALTTYDTSLTERKEYDYGLYGIRLPEGVSMIEGSVLRIADQNDGDIFWDQYTGNLPGVGVEKGEGEMDVVVRKKQNADQRTISEIRAMADEVADEVFKKVFAPDLERKRD